MKADAGADVENEKETEPVVTKEEEINGEQKKKAYGLRQTEHKSAYRIILIKH